MWYKPLVMSCILMRMNCRNQDYKLLLAGRIIVDESRSLLCMNAFVLHD